MPSPHAPMTEWIRYHNSSVINVGSNPTGRAKIQELQMFQFLKRLFCFHGAVEIDHTIDGDEIKVCRSCLKEIK